MNTLRSLQGLLRYGLDSDRPVGKGGCGEIWKAKDFLFDKPVAIKTVSENLRWHSEEKAFRSFRKEAAVAARLGELSPHILKITDLGIVDGTMYSVMDWIDPEPGFQSIDLAERAGKMSLALAKGIIRQVSDAVALAHSHGVIHSDIAPGNIVFDSNQHTFMLADFGLLRIVEECLVSFGSGSLLCGGRLDFFPPEVKDSIQNVSYASDVYALAITLRVLLEGFSFLQAGGRFVPTPAVIRIHHEQRDAPDQVRRILHRFVDTHTTHDTVQEFIKMLQDVPS